MRTLLLILFLLHSNLLYADLNTNSNTSSDDKVNQIKSTVSKLSKPGDNKDGYLSKDYESGSKSLQRTGKPADLYTIATTQQLGLPKLKLPEGTDLTPEKINLGRKLFFDRRLSHTDTISCAICHVPEMGFAQNELATAVGTEGRSVPRNAPTVVNVAFLSRLFHDARENNLEDQVWGPLLAHNEMANPSPGYILNKLKSIPDYEGLFEIAYGGPVNMDSLSRALAAYQYSLISCNSPFDKWYYGGESKLLQNLPSVALKFFQAKVIVWLVI